MTLIKKQRKQKKKTKKTKKRLKILKTKKTLKQKQRIINQLNIAQSMFIFDNNNALPNIIHLDMFDHGGEFSQDLVGHQCR